MNESGMNMTSAIDFAFNPEPRNTEVSTTQGSPVKITIMAQNCSDRPVTVHPFLSPVDSTPAFDNEPVAADEWRRWLSIEEEEPELEFEEDGTHPIHVFINLPAYAPLGSYRFQLILSGVENPDEEYAASSPITFTVTGPKADMRPLAIGSAVVLVVAILAIIAAVLLLNRPRLQVTLDAPKDVAQGELFQYTLHFKNNGSGPAKNVMVEYTPPKAILAASAYVDGETLRHCDAVITAADSHLTDRANPIRCDLDAIAQEKTVNVIIQAVPGPVKEDMTITNITAGKPDFQVSAGLDESGKISDIPLDLNKKQTKITVKSTAKDAVSRSYAAALLPSTRTPVIGEDFTYRVRAWSTLEFTEAAAQELKFTFSLPVGMRYVEPLPKGCARTGQYFEVSCSASLQYTNMTDQVKTIDLHARAASVVPSTATLSIAGDIKKAVTTTVNSALSFDGVDDWVQLGYNQAPKKFTVEMWVQPFSTEDGQSFAGLHRREPDGTVSNVFLVGYWIGSLHVNVNGVSHNLVTPKVTERFHLAVVVEDISDKLSRVTVYVNGVAQEWEEKDTQCGSCKIFTSTMPGGENPLPWVLGQDWDTGRMSDFFHGTLSEVRIWNEARTSDQIMDTYLTRPRGDEAALAAYYRLEPIDQSSDALASRAAAALPGTRLGATWVEAAPRYGTALKFNGHNQALAVPGLKMADFKADQGSVNITLAGWIKVDEIPSQQEWILGSTVPSSSTLAGLSSAGSQAEMTKSLVSEEQAGLQNAKAELEAARQAANDLKLDAAQVVLDSYLVRQQLFSAVDTLSQSSRNEEMKEVKTSGLLDPLAPLPAGVPELLKSSNSEILKYATSVQDHYTRYLAMKSEYDQLIKIVPTPTATPAPSPTPVPRTVQICDTSYFLFFKKYDCHDETIVPTPIPTAPGLAGPASVSSVQFDSARVGLQMLRILLADERAQYYANLQSLYEAAKKNNIDLGASAALPRQTKALLDKAQDTAVGVTTAYDKLKAYPPYTMMHALALTEYELAEAKKTDEKNGSWSSALHSLQAAQGELDGAEARLDVWLKSEMQGSLQAQYTDLASRNKAREYFINLGAAQTNFQLYQATRANLKVLQASQERIAAAQEQLDAAQARDRAVEEATRWSQDSQARLEGAGADLETVLFDQYSGLQSAQAAQQMREKAVANLEPLLDAAVDQAAEAAFTSIKEYNIGSWIITYLDLKLDKHTLRQVAEDAIRPAVLQAAKKALKTGASGNAAGQQELQKALAAKAQLASLNGKASLSQQIVDQVGTYLDSLDQGAGEAPIPPALTDALAETIADRITAETVQCLAYDRVCASLLSAGLQREQVKKAVKAEISNAVEATRWSARIRLFHEDAHAITRLESELAAGGGSDDAGRQARVALRNRLSTVNAALFQLLRPASKPVDQAAGASDTQYENFQKALGDASGSLGVYLKAARMQGKISAVAISPGGAAGGIDMPNMWAGLLVDEDGHVMLAVRRVYGSDWIIRKDEKPLQPGQWVHYAAVFRYVPLTDTIVIDDASPILYRDGSPVKGGVKVQPSQAINTTSCPAGFYIGGLCDPSGRFFFAGQVDEVRVWNRGLKKEEIDTWRKLPGTVFDEKAYWAFDDGPRSSTGYLTPAGSVTLPLRGPGWVESDIKLFQEASPSQ